MQSKVAILLIACLVQSISAEDTGYLPIDIARCAEKENVPFNVLVAYTQKGIPTTEATESLPNYKCLFTCVIEGSKLVDGCSINLPNDTVEAKDEARVKALRSCKDTVNLKGTERCECGYEIYKCVMDYFIKNGFE